MNRLRDLREDNDWTLQHIADIFGTTNSAISKYELGRCALTEDLIIKFCKLYHVTADYLLGLSAQREPTVSNSDTALLCAYHAASPEIRSIVDHALDPYKQEQDASSAAS